ncbi:MAG: hypothetical protein Q9218_000252 [Villophora microphyllina]
MACFSCVITVPADGSTISTSTATAKAGPNSNDVLNLASDLWAIQFLGSQNAPIALAVQCPYWDGGRFLAAGYNTTSIHDILCQANNVFAAADLPSIEQVRNLTIQYSSWIWIFQAVGAMQNDRGKLKELCRMIDVPSAFAIGQNGTLVKNTICSVAHGAALPTVPLPQFVKG